MVLGGRIERDLPFHSFGREIWKRRNYGGRGMEAPMRLFGG